MQTTFLRLQLYIMYSSTRQLQHGVVSTSFSACFVDYTFDCFEDLIFRCCGTIKIETIFLQKQQDAETLELTSSAPEFYLHYAWLR